MSDRRQSSSASDKNTNTSAAAYASAAASSTKKRPISADDLRNFYFSRSSNFAAFQHTAQHNSSGRSSQQQQRGGSRGLALSPAVGSAVRAARSALDDNNNINNQSQQLHDDEYDDHHQQLDQRAADERNNNNNNKSNNNNNAAASKNQQQQRPGSAAPTSSSSTGRGGNRMQLLRASDVQGGDGVSNEYVSFLKDQQSILKTHQYVKQTIESIHRSIAEHQAAFKQLTDECAALVHKAETSSGWNWRSNFTREQLVHDAALDVPFEELLRQDDVPNVAALQHLLQNIHKLRHELAGVARQQALSDGGKSSARFQPFFSLLENGTRKVERFVSEFSQMNIDATPIAKLPDTLLVQMDNALRIPPLSRIVEETLLRLESLEQRRQECIRTRETAIEDGDMDVAERQSVDLAALSEECTSCIQEKLKILERVSEEHAVLQRVCAGYEKGFTEAVVALEEESSGRKAHCEDDLGRLYALKEKMTTVEHVNRERWEKSKAASDARLQGIDAEQTKVWNALMELAARFSALEEQRHTECKRRVEEKAEEEGRRNDYSVFVATLEAYAKSLERTVDNMSLRVVSTQIMADFVRGGFSSIQKDITTLKNNVDSELLEAHRAHLSAFRNLIFILGELEYRKERKVEEYGQQIQNAHIQLEMCSDSLNAQAKRFADERNELTKRLHLVEHDVEKLRERQQTALALFSSSAAALSNHGVDFEHPLNELEDWKLETRARMVDFRAVAVGGVKSKPLRENLNALASSLEESRSRLFTKSRMSPTVNERRMLQ